MLIRKNKEIESDLKKAKNKVQLLEKKSKTS